MKRSTERILTTHTGSLPRPSALLASLKQRGSTDDSDFASRLRSAVAEIVRKQVDAGIDVINDGELSKESYSTYVRERLTGFEGEPEQATKMPDLEAFPGYANRLMSEVASAAESMLRPPACVGEIKVKDRKQLQRDIDNLRAATKDVKAEEVFMSSASPGVVSLFFANHHYPTREAYLAAIADAMKDEYEAIVAAGFVLQLDCPDLAMGRHLQFPELTSEEFRKEARLNVEALNHATANIDPDRMRIHLCWGNYEGPHHYDVPLKDIVDIILEARPNGISLEACNPRHEHEWEVFKDVRLPDGKVLIPGVIDSTTNYIEHPELVAQRLLRYAELVGRENVLAGSDCGFATSAQVTVVDPEITWAKFEAMAEGARIASERLW
jgi:5-methyltetrahydropteroyltriglutamate--homocysteine methyltransferase